MWFTILSLAYLSNETYFYCFQAVTESGQKISEIEISDENVSEILRIFMKCRAGKESDLCKRLRETPLQCFVMTHRAQVLAYLCNELLNNKAVTAVTSTQPHSCTTYWNARRPNLSALASHQQTAKLRTPFSQPLYWYAIS